MPHGEPQTNIPSIYYKKCIIITNVYTSCNIMTEYKQFSYNVSIIHVLLLSLLHTSVDGGLALKGSGNNLEIHCHIFSRWLIQHHIMASPKLFY